MESMFTSPKTMRLAVATKIFPGPTILSTLGIVRVPNARAATAWAPPTRKIRSDAGDMRRGENNRAVVADRRGHDDLFDAGDFGGNHVHQNRRRIGRLAAGYIDPDALERRDALAKQHAERIAILPTFLQLAAMKRGDPFGRKPQRGQILARHLAERALDLRGLHFDRRRGSDGYGRTTRVYRSSARSPCFCTAPTISDTRRSTSPSRVPRRPRIFLSNGLKPASDVLTNLISFMLARNQSYIFYLELLNP